jgi:NodT family efflux transporter outer membrane factor (OMF) lipoprotein
MEPTALIEFLHEAQPIPPVPPEIPLGIPSEILRRRPDIRAAERKLATVTAEIGVAVAALFPRFALTGEYFLQASTLSRLFQWNSSTWMINPGMTFPIFHGGRLWANIDIQKARHEHELAEYQRTVLTALTDVENAIVAYSKEKERYHALAETVEANRRVHHLTKDRYDKGLGSLVEVINAQQPLFESEKALTDSQETLTLHLVALYKALGGGWEEFIPPHKPSQVGSSKLNHKKSLRHKK